MSIFWLFQLRLPNIIILNCAAQFYLHVFQNMPYLIRTAQLRRKEEALRTKEKLLQEREKELERKLSLQLIILIYKCTLICEINNSMYAYLKILKFVMKHKLNKK